MHLPCVGAVVYNDDGRLLVVRRGHEPDTGRWSIPGGRVETGETDEQAVVREVLEETGLHVTVGAHLGTVQRPASGVVLDIRDYACAMLVPGTTPIAGDDATEVRWVERSELADLDVVDGLVDALTEWGALPR